MSDTIFVAGASGAIGRRLCPLLIKDGWTVIGTTRSAEKSSILRVLGVQPVVVDAFDRDALISIVREARPSVVIHQLTDLPFALDASRMAHARVRNARLREEGTRNLVSASLEAGVRRVVAQSIAFAYAPGPRPYTEVSPLNTCDAEGGLTARAVESLERQILEGPFVGIVLRYGKLYGPGTGFENPAKDGPVHVDAAADAARLAVTLGTEGIYNVAEEDGMVSSRKAVSDLGWNPSYRYQ